MTASTPAVIPLQGAGGTAEGAIPPGCTGARRLPPRAALAAGFQPFERALIRDGGVLPKMQAAVVCV